MYCRPSIVMRIELELPEIIDSLDLEIIIRYFLDDRDPTIQDIIKEYGNPHVQSQRVRSEDGTIRPNQKCFSAFNLDRLPLKGIDLKYLSYRDFIDHVFENCVTYL